MEVIDWVKPAERVTVWWQVLAYLIITVAEILISVTGLELAFVAAPQSMKSFVTACWLAVVFLANLLINAPITQLYPLMEPGVYFAMLAGAMAVVTVVFVPDRGTVQSGDGRQTRRPPRPRRASQGDVTGSVPRHGGIDAGRPCLDPAGHRVDVLQPGGLLEDRRPGQAADAVVAVDDHRRAGRRLDLTGPARQFAQRDQVAVRQPAVGVLLRLPHVE